MVGKHTKAKQAKTGRARKQRVTFQLPAELIEKARDVVYFTPGLTMSGLVEVALRMELAQAEKKRRKPFPSRGSAVLRTGRPVGS